MTIRSLLAAAVFALSTGLAMAQDPGKCQPMTLKSDDVEKAIHHVDVHEEGASRGDWRVGHRRLLDEDGNEVGYRRWVAVALDPPPGKGDRSEIIANIVLVLPDGRIHIQTFIDAGRPIDSTDASVLLENVQGTGVVVGGTGAYEFARGSYASTRDGETRTYLLNIKCD